MRNLVCKFVVVAVAVAVAATAQASILDQFATWDGPVHHALNNGLPFVGGGEDKLTDESVAKLYDPDNDGFTPGDIVYGWISVSEILASPGAHYDIGLSQQLAMVYAGKLGNPVGNIFPVLPVGNINDPLDLRKLLHTDISTGAGLDDDSVIVVIGNEFGSGEGAESPQDFNEATAPLEILEFNNSDASDPTRQWFWEATAGIVNNQPGELNIHGSVDWWEVAVHSPPPDIVAVERGGFTIQSHAYGSTVWLPVDVMQLSGPGAPNNLITLNDAVLAYANVFPPLSENPPWDLGEDNSIFVINPVPEPGTLAVWLGFGLLFGAVAIRRRRR